VMGKLMIDRSAQKAPHKRRMMFASCFAVISPADTNTPRTTSQRRHIPGHSDSLSR
jgi:hypothetical protein